jgi:hypothetical protein
VARCAPRLAGERIVHETICVSARNVLALGFARSISARALRNVLFGRSGVPDCMYASRYRRMNPLRFLNFFEVALVQSVKQRIDQGMQTRNAIRWDLLLTVIRRTFTLLFEATTFGSGTVNRFYRSIHLRMDQRHLLGG